MAKHNANVDVKGDLRVRGRIKDLSAPVDPNDAARLADVTGGTSGGGFYGVTVGQSDDFGTFRGINTVKFESANFYVTQNDPNTDEVQVNFRGTAGSGGITDHGDLDGLSDDDHTQYVLTNGARNITGDFVMEQHLRVGDTLDVENSVTAEAFYLGSGWDLTYTDIQFDIPTVEVENYWIHNFALQSFVIEGVQIISKSGSCTAAFYIHGDAERTPGVSVTGLDPISVSTTKTSTTATGSNTVNAGDSVVLSVESNTSATHLRGRLSVSLLK